MVSDVNSPKFWEEIYRGGRAGWDLGGPTPVFQRILRERNFEPGRTIVLGAGRGHDARMFARRGFEVTAVDFAEEAVQGMRDLADPEAPVQILQADIFELPSELHGNFDYLLEYTCFCAIDPDRREEYAEIASHLLQPGGTLIALLFPVTDRPGGPPFGVDPEEFLRLFLNQDFDLLHRERPSDSVSQRQGVEELVILKKPA